MNSVHESNGISPCEDMIEGSGDSQWGGDVSAAEDQDAGMNDPEMQAKKGAEMGTEVAAGGEDHAAGGQPGEEEEGAGPRGMAAPKTPSAREVEAHELTHCPPRSWCDHCVKGQAKDAPHRAVKGEYADSSIVRVAMDYCFLSEDVVAESSDHGQAESAKTVLTVLLMVETLCHSIWAYACESKGASEAWMVEQMVEDFQTVGLTNERLILKSDQENSIKELQRAVAEARAGHGTAIENSRVGDSNSNGKVERAIQDFKGLVRTLRSDLESKIGRRIRLDDPIVPWMVRHAAHLINVSRVRHDGRTAFQLMKGRRSNGKHSPFIEIVLFLIPNGQQNS